MLIRWWRSRRKATPFTPTDAERRQLSEHLQYDIQMTFDLAEVLNGMPTPPSSALDVVVRNALLESFLVRARSVVEFLWNDTRKGKEDALAADYFDPGEWKKMRHARPQRLNRLVTAKVGWGAVHLTYRRARSTPADKRWEPVRMSVALEPTARLFIDNVDPAQFDTTYFPAIKPYLDRFKAKYGHVTP